MTHLEAYTILKTRVEWQKPLDAVFSFLDFDSPESERYLQEEHSAVRINIIKDCCVPLDIENTDFQNELQSFKKKAILQMLHDVFYDKKELREDWILNNTELYDYAIILKNTINTISQILGSSRTNDTTIISKENLSTWYIDLNGIKDKENGVFVSGYVERYRREIQRIRKVLFIRRSLTVVTAQ